MKNQLNRIHNLMLNCSDLKDFRDHLIFISLDNIYNEQYDHLLDNLLVDGKLAGECSILPIYYLKASERTGMKQDKDGSWYKA